MTVKTLRYIEVDSDPMDPVTQDLRPEYDNLATNITPFTDALLVLVDQPEGVDCDQCGDGVGYYLEEADDGRLEHAYWHYTALILHGPEFPVVVLCEDCAAPVIQPMIPCSWREKK